MPSTTFRSAALAAFALALHASSAGPALAQNAAPAAPRLPAAVAEARLDAATRRLVVDSIAQVLRARYVDAEIAERLAARLRDRLASGAYDAQVSPPEFGAALMRDLQGVIADKHLRLSYEPEREFSLTPPPAGTASPASPAVPGAPVRWGRIDGRDPAAIARTNFAFERVERLPGNVGYLKLDQFVPLDLSRETAAAAMAFVANSDAVIVDLRNNVGGSPDLMEFVLSYFFGPEPVSLITTYGRFANVTVERRTLREVPGRRVEGADLWILTSRNSASAAESFAYAAQRLRRGTLVGDTTAGAGNGGAKISVGAGLALFVPQFRVVSGPGFEATGVAPDVVVDAEDALAEAHRRALERLASREAAPEVKREREWALELVRARQSPAPVSPTELGRYAGRYGSRTIRVGDGGLESVGATGWTERLVPLGGGVFRGTEARLRFETDAAGTVTALVMETASGRTTRVARSAS